MKKIAILTDFSYCSEKAARIGMSLFGNKNVSYTFIHSIYIKQAGHLVFLDLTKDIKAYAEHRIKTFTSKYQNTDNSLNIDYRIEVGTIKQTVTHLIEDEHWDCFILGTNGSDSYYEKIIGSTASLLLKQTGINMLVVPVASQEKNIHSASFPLEINLCNLHNYTGRIKSILDERLNLIEIFMIHDTDESEQLTERTIREWSDGHDERAYQFTKCKSNGESLENQIIETVVGQQTDLLILAPHKEKSFWKRIFDYHMSERIVEKSLLPVLILN